MTWCRPGYSLSDSEEWIGDSEARWRLGARFDFGVHAVEGGRFLGAVSINGINFEHRFGNLGYWIRTSPDYS
jgi:hypothetical protein